MDLNAAIDRVEGVITNLENQIQSGKQMGYISTGNGSTDRKDRLYHSLVTELLFNRILLDALSLKRDTLYKDQAATWKRYIKYLLGWAEARQDPECFGSSPADFDEWKSWEHPEDEEEVGGYYFDDFGDYIPTSR